MVPTFNRRVEAQQASWLTQFVRSARAKLVERRPVDSPQMEMYSVYKDIVVAAVEQSGGKVLDLRPDTWAGDAWVSYTYCVTKAEPSAQKPAATSPQQRRSAAPDPAVEAAFQQLAVSIPGFEAALQNEIAGFDSWKCMPRSTYEQKDVLDLGCGNGVASALLLQRGANFVWGVDPLLTDEHIHTLSVLPRGRSLPAVC
jgi:hypothetical protein